MRNLLSILSFILLVGLFNSVFAQASGLSQASLTASARILSDITVSAESDLEFGDIFTSSPTTVSAGSPQAGHFLISSPNNNTKYTIDIELPDNLLNSANSPLPITYDLQGSRTETAQSGLFYIGNNASAFNGVTYSTGPGQGVGTILRSLFIGGTVTPLPDSPGGDYSAQIIITVEIL